MLVILIALVVAAFRLTLDPLRPEYPSVTLVKFHTEEYRHVVQLGLCHLQLMHSSCTVDGCILSRYFLWLSYLLFLAGDIAANPGPVRFPCTVCNCPVCVNQRGIQCDKCVKWTHVKCAHISMDFYHRMDSQVEFSWFCPSCLFLELPLCSSGGFNNDSDDDEVRVAPTSVDAPLLITDVLSQSFNGIRIVHHNIQGLLSKSIDIREWLGACNGLSCVFCLTETWVKPETPFPSIPGYQMFHSPFIPCTSGAGRYLPESCLFTSDLLSPERSSLCEDIEKSCTSLNVCCCSLKCKLYKVAVVCIYRSPSIDVSKCLEDLHDLLSQLFVSCKYVLLAGDLNIDLLCASSSRERYSNILTDFQLI